MNKILSSYINSDCSTIIEKYMRFVSPLNIIHESTKEGYFLYMCSSCDFPLEINIEDLWMDGDIRCYIHDKSSGIKYYYNCDNCQFKNYFNLELKCKNCLSIKIKDNPINCRCHVRRYNCYRCYGKYCQDCMDKQYYCKYFYDNSKHCSTTGLLFCADCHN